MNFNNSKQIIPFRQFKLIRISRLETALLDEQVRRTRASLLNHGKISNNYESTILRSISGSNLSGLLLMSTVIQ